MRAERNAAAPTARSLAVSRFAARRTVLIATGVTVFLLSLALSSLVALGIRGPLIATRATLDDSAISESSVIVSAAPAGSTAAQDAGVRRVIHSTFAGVPVSVTRRRVAASGRTAAAITWTVTPNASTITPSELGRLATAFAHIDARVDSSAAARSPAAQVSGRGPQTVSEMRAAIAAVDTVLPIPLTVLSLAGIIALLLCARLLAATRENEARLLRARGASVRTLVLADSTEVAVPAAVGAVAGGIVAQLTLALVLGTPTSVLEVVVAPLAILLTALIVSAISGGVAARAANGAPRPSAGRAGVAAALSLASLLVIVSAIATWRFLQYGTPAVGRPPDAAAILAPALLLCTAALLSLILFFPVTGWLQRRASRTPGMLRVLPARTLHRNPRLFAGPIALLVISVATATMAAGYASTWAGFLGDSTRLVTGSDVRATFGGTFLDTDASTVLDSATYRKLPGVRAVVPVLRESATVSDENITAIGVSIDHATDVVGPTSSVLDVSALVRALHPTHDPLPGIELPKGTTSVGMRVTAGDATGAPASVLTTLWFADDLGDLAPIALATQKIDATTSTATRSALVPPAGPWRIVAIDAEVSAAHQLRDFAFQIGSLSTRGGAGGGAIAVLTKGAWKPQGAVFNDGVSTAGPAGAIGFTRATVRGGVNTAVRLMPPGSATVPVVVSRALAQANDLRIGDHVDVEGQWASFGATVARIVPLVPGVTSQASLIGDLSSIDNGWLRSSEQLPSLHELWIAGSPDVAIAREVASTGGGRTTAASGSVSRRFVGGAVTGLWLGAAGSAAFAVVTLIASLASVVRRRTREVGVLRALGMAARDQAAMRRSEIVLVIAFGLVVGVVTGAGMLALTVGTLARSSTPEAPGVLPLALRFDPVAPALLVIALVMIAALIVWRYLAVIVRTAAVAKP